MRVSSDALADAGVLTPEEREGLLESSLGHDAVVGWLSVLFDAAVADGRLGAAVARAPRAWSSAGQA